MTDKVTVVFEALNYFRKFNENEVVRVVILKNKNSLYDINVGIGTNKTIDKKITKEDKLIKEELKELSKSLEMGEEVDLTSDVIKEKMRSAISNTLKSYNKYYEMLEFFKSKMYVNPIELAYSYSFIEYLNLAQSEQEKEMDDIDFGNTNLTMYLKKVLEYK